MWLVKNNLRATLTFKGLDVSIPAGEQFDLDTIGRERAEELAPVIVAFEEGYLENVYKAPRQEPEPEPTPAPAPLQVGISAAEFDERMHAFRQSFVDELKQQLSGIKVKPEGGMEVDQGVVSDVRSLVDEIKLLRDRIDNEKVRVKRDPKLSDGEVRARLAYLDEQEQELMRNFETIGKRVEQDDGDIMDKADLLAGL